MMASQFCGGYPRPDLTSHTACGGGGRGEGGDQSARPATAATTTGLRACSLSTAGQLPVRVDSGGQEANEEPCGPQSAVNITNKPLGGVWLPEPGPQGPSLRIVFLCECPWMRARCALVCLFCLVTAGCSGAGGGGGCGWELGERGHRGRLKKKSSREAGTQTIQGWSSMGGTWERTGRGGRAW